MSLYPIGRARRLAKERLKDVLGTYLGAEITAAVADDDWTTPPTMPGLSGPEAIFLTHPDMPDKLPRNFGVYVYIYEDAPRVIERTNSTTGSTYKSTTTQDYKTVLLFQYELDGDVADEDGNTPEVDVVMRHRADLYIEAVCNAIYKHAATANQPIHQVELIDDMPITYLTDQYTALGAATLTWRVTQLVSIPTPTC